MTEAPFFSLVVPTYNRADLIGKTLDSLLRINYPHYEILVIDDGSTDGTMEIVMPLASEKLKYFRKENAERGAARNYGRSKAKGDYVNFFDSDDLAYPDHLAVAAHAVRQLANPEVFALGYDVKNEAGSVIREVSDLDSPVNASLITGNHLSINGVFVRKDVAEQWPFSEDRALSASEDYALWMRLSARYNLYFVQSITSSVIDHQARSVVTINRRQFMNRMDALSNELWSDHTFRDQFGKQWNKFKAFQEIYMALHLGLAGIKGRESFVHAKNAALLYPPSIFTRRFAAAVKHCLL